MGASCTGDKQGSVATLYSARGDVSLYRCQLTVRYALSLNCFTDYPGSVTESRYIGTCDLAPGRCGATPLYQLRNTATGDFFVTTDPNYNPTGWDRKVVCHVWPPPMP